MEPGFEGSRKLGKAQQAARSQATREGARPAREPALLGLGPRLPTRLPTGAPSAAGPPQTSWSPRLEEARGGDRGDLTGGTRLLRGSRPAWASPPDERTRGHRPQAKDGQCLPRPETGGAARDPRDQPQAPGPAPAARGRSRTPEAPPLCGWGRADPRRDLPLSGVCRPGSGVRRRPGANAPESPRG